MKKKNIIFGFVSSVLLLIAYFISNYRLYAQEYLKVLKYMDIRYIMSYVAIIPIILLTIHFIILLIKKENNNLTKILLIVYEILNICISLCTGISIGTFVNIVVHGILLLYLINVFYVKKLPINNKAIICVFAIIIIWAIIGNIYSLVQYFDLIKITFSYFAITISSNILGIIAYVLLAIYYNSLYFENKTLK